eukprot:9590582-Lingulodinium_polyedra.AAC.1
MGTREGATDESPVRLMGYLTAIVQGRHPPDKMGVRNARELETLAQCLDLLAEGRLQEVADILMQ